jgi:1,4-alpha-glucan branching enzyme
LFNKFAVHLNAIIMAITKQFLKSKPVCKVTFIVPAEAAKEVKVIGSFNKWNSEETPLKKLKNGNFKGTVDLETEKSYEFRYLVDGQYTNDEEADSYAWNDFAAAENGVLEL